MGSTSRSPQASLGSDRTAARSGKGMPANMDECMPCGPFVLLYLKLMLRTHRRNRCS